MVYKFGQDFHVATNCDILQEMTANSNPAEGKVCLNEYIAIHAILASKEQFIQTLIIRGLHPVKNCKNTQSFEENNVHLCRF